MGKKYIGKVDVFDLYAKREKKTGNKIYDFFKVNGKAHLFSDQNYIFMHFKNFYSSNSGLFNLRRATHKTKF